MLNYYLIPCFYLFLSLLHPIFLNNVTEKITTVPSNTVHYANPISSPTYTLTESRYKTFYNGDFEIYNLKKQGSSYGQAIYINRRSKNINAKYFAHKDAFDNSVYNRFKSWKSDKQVIMACSGAYTTKNYSTPEGITVDNGIIVNNYHESKMDGLVIVYATGGIVISDIKDGDLYLGSLNKTINVSKKNDVTRLLDWAVDENATVFQTHLLAYKNQLRTYNNGSSRTDKRRLLSLVKNNNDEVLHLIYNIEAPSTLYDAANTTFNHLKDKGLNVIAMINLDRGMYDILEIYDQYGNLLHTIKGETQIEKATNLITYHHTK